MRRGEAWVEHAAKGFPLLTLKRDHVVAAEEPVEVVVHEIRFWEGLSGRDILRGQLWIGDEERSRTKRPEVDVEHFSQLILLADVVGIDVWVGVWREVSFTFGSDGDVT